MNYKDGVSVVICCYNSEKRIVPTLEHLDKQENIDFDWEVLVVDNNSKDATSTIALQQWKNSIVPFKVVKESRPGTRYARETGISSSSFRYVLFCDDDNWLQPQYVSIAYQCIRRDIGIAAVGGMGIIKLETGLIAPFWLDAFKNNYGCGPQGKEDGDTTYYKGCLYTAGAIFDRMWLDRLQAKGFQSSLTGRDGKTLVAGEDTELTLALNLLGAKLHYSSQLHFQHFMPENRMQWAYLRKLNFSFGRSNFLLSPYFDRLIGYPKRSVLWVIYARLRLFLNARKAAQRVGLEEGREEVLKYEKAKGELIEALTNTKTFLTNRNMVEKLART